MAFRICYLDVSHSPDRVVAAAAALSDCLSGWLPMPVWGLFSSLARKWKKDLYLKTPRGDGFRAGGPDHMLFYHQTLLSRSDPPRSPPPSAAGVTAASARASYHRISTRSPFQRAHNMSGKIISHGRLGVIKSPHEYRLSNCVLSCCLLPPFSVFVCVCEESKDHFRPACVRTRSNLHLEMTNVRKNASIREVLKPLICILQPSSSSSIYPLCYQM